MTVRTRGSFSGGDFRDGVKEYREIRARAVTAAVTAATEGMKREFRQQLDRAFPSSRKAPNIVGSRVYPKAPRFSIGAAGTIFPRGPSAERIVDAFARGVTIVAKRVRYLAIPTDAVPMKRASNGHPVPMTPLEVEAHFDRDLEFVNAKRRGVGLLILPGRVKGRLARRTSARKKLVKARRTESDQVMFILVRRARMPKRLAPELLAQKWADAIPDLIDRAMPGA